MKFIVLTRQKKKSQRLVVTTDFLCVFLEHVYEDELTMIKGPYIFSATSVITGH